jgi:hypothetical protein
MTHEEKKVILASSLGTVTMVYDPIAAALAESFPTRIRYTVMSLPYHIANDWFGDLLPAAASRWWRRPGISSSASDTLS